MRGPSRVDRQRATEAGTPLARAFTQNRFRLIGTANGGQEWRCLNCGAVVRVTQPPGQPFGEWWRVVTTRHPFCPGDQSWN